MSDGPFDEQERQALSKWTAEAPPEDLEARVFQALEQPEVKRSDRPRRLRWWVPASAAAAAIAVFSVLGLPEAERAALQVLGTQGQHRAAERTTLALMGSAGKVRATVVSEAGTVLSWRALEDVLHVEQTQGSAFYRVEPGAFEVSTPAGLVRVLGTCFRVEVQNMDKKTVASGVAGAALSAMITVTVYEGKVVASNEKGRVEIAAGESVDWPQGQPPGRTRDRAVRAASRTEALASTAARQASPGGAAARAPAEQLRTLAQEKKRLQAQVQGLQAKLQALKYKADETKTYDLEPAQLERMAQRCELRWDIPPLSAKPPMLSEESFQKLQISPAEREVINEKFARSHASLVEDVRAIYREATGDDSAGSMATVAMVDEVRDKTPIEETRRIFRALSHERAGLIQPPASREGLPPTERLFRRLTEEGDRLQAAIAQELGPEVARSTRDLHQGWGSRYRSSHGCPK